MTEKTKLTIMDTAGFITFLLVISLAMFDWLGPGIIFGAPSEQQPNLPEGVSYEYSPPNTADVAERLPVNREDVIMTRKGDNIFITVPERLPEPARQQLDDLFRDRIPRGFTERESTE